MLFHTPSWASPLRCDKAVISGEFNWPPFSYIEEGRLEGAGIDLGRILFHELNIPVEVRPIKNQSELEHQLRNGQVDLLVATYDVPKYEKIIRLVLPNYYEDTLAVAVASGKYFEFSDWHDLMGRAGVTPENKQLGREFRDFATKHLNVKAVGDLRYNFKQLAAGEFEYVIGSAQLLRTGVNRYGNGEIEFLPRLVSAEDVYMGFSEASECKGYTAYFRNRLKELNEKQIVYTLVQKHTEATGN